MNKKINDHTHTHALICGVVVVSFLKNNKLIRYTYTHTHKQLLSLFLNNDNDDNNIIRKFPPLYRLWQKNKTTPI